jgi:hypothetical protein
MSTKSLIFWLSLAGSAVGVVCWVLVGEFAENAPPAVTSDVMRVRAAPVRTAVKQTGPTIPRPSAKASSASDAKTLAASKVGQHQIAAQRLTTEELTARAARVEQEANHDLRRLVKLLDLSEDQQDKVFQTLAQHSPLWTQGMQIAPAAGPGSATTTGKRSEPLTTAPGIYTAPVVGEIPEPVKTGPPPIAGEVPAPVKAPAVPGEDIPATTPDPMDEIMAYLNPDQQDTLIQEEMDRIAWWAEILPQLLPPDDVPAIDGGTPAVPAPGQTETYEGADVLE